MARRLVRAKAKMRGAKIPYRVPDAELLPERLEPVLAVLYLIFNEGYAASAGDALVRRELASEAIRLARVLAELLPNDTEVRGLLALMLLHDARRDARVDASGDLRAARGPGPRALGPRADRRGARAVRRQARRGRRRRPYALQAQIAARHVAGARFADIDWPAIAELYGGSARSSRSRWSGSTAPWRARSRRAPRSG